MRSNLRYSQLEQTHVIMYIQSFKMGRDSEQNCKKKKTPHVITISEKTIETAQLLFQRVQHS